MTFNHLDNDDTAARIGANLAKQLRLRPDPAHKDRWLTDKTSNAGHTAAGVARRVQRLLDGDRVKITDEQIQAIKSSYAINIYLRAYHGETDFVAGCMTPKALNHVHTIRNEVRTILGRRVDVDVLGPRPNEDGETYEISIMIEATHDEQKYSEPDTITIDFVSDGETCMPV